MLGIAQSPQTLAVLTQFCVKCFNCNRYTFELFLYTQYMDWCVFFQNLAFLYVLWAKNKNYFAFWPLCGTMVQHEIRAVFHYFSLEH